MVTRRANFEFFRKNISVTGEIPRQPKMSGGKGNGRGTRKIGVQALLVDSCGETQAGGDGKVGQNCQRKYIHLCKTEKSVLGWWKGGGVI